MNSNNNANYSIDAINDLININDDINYLMNINNDITLFMQVDDLKNRLGLDAQAQKVDWGTLGVLGSESLTKLK